MLEVNFGLSWNYKGKKGTETFFHTAIGNFMTAMRDWGPAFRAMVTEVLMPSVTEQFESEGRGQWAPLKESTIRRKGHAIILMGLTGNLKYSFLAKGNSQHVEEITRESLRWGSLVPYGPFHQTGTGDGFQQRNPPPSSVGIAMRKIIELSDQDKREMRSILVSRLAIIARKEGFATVDKGSNVDAWSARRIGKTLLGL